MSDQKSRTEPNPPARRKSANAAAATISQADASIQTSRTGAEKFDIS